MWGVTVTNPYAVDATVEALRALPVRTTVRIVFDEDQKAATYRDLVPRYHAAADVMGELLDSLYVERIGVEGYRDRAREYMDAFAGSVDVWEIGNEINGEWLGKTPDVRAKIGAAWDEAQARRLRTALTLSYNEGCFESADHAMFAWAEANVPRVMKDGVDYLLVSYYEDDCNAPAPDWNRVFAHLAAMFPRAALGFGEVGTKHAEKKAADVRRWYSMRIDEPRFVGGYFWWYFSDDMVPKDKPLWRTLADVMPAR